MSQVLFEIAIALLLLAIFYVLLTMSSEEQP